LPDYVKKTLTRLGAAGHVAYVVGGSVRDFLLERPSKDHDIATSASPDELCELFPDAITVGKAFGVIKIPVAEKHLLEIATFREDLSYVDHRHPSAVRFSGPEEDARRRDFTINALFYDPKTARILDAVNGVADLKAGVIRAIGEPRERFREDALRLLRAARFATALGFEIEKDTAAAIRDRARLLSRVSAERVRDELTLMLTGTRPDEAIKLLSDLGLLKIVLPEIDAFKGVEQSSIYHPEGDVWKHTMKTLRWLERQEGTRSVILSWAALLHDVGKPTAFVQNAGKNFNGHETEGARLAAVIGERLKMSRDEIDAIVWIIENHLKFKDVFQMREATLQRFIRHDYFEELLALHRADATASDGNLAYYEFCLRRLCELRSKPERGVLRLVTGADLIALGLKPGPEFALILRAVEDLAFEGKLKTRDDALKFVSAKIRPQP
jgi:poly(A) polymerase